jgi:hypothetical protein
MASTVTVQHPEIDRARGTLRAIWLRLGTPLLIVLMALAIVLTITRNWTSWEGGRSEQVTNDAYVRREITPLSTKVVGLVREVKVSDCQHVRQGEELVVLADDDYRGRRTGRGQSGAREQSSSARTPGLANSTCTRGNRAGHGSTRGGSRREECRPGGRRAHTSRACAAGGGGAPACSRRSSRQEASSSCAR